MIEHEQERSAQEAVAQKIRAMYSKEVSLIETGLECGNLTIVTGQWGIGKSRSLIPLLSDTLQEKGCVVKSLDSQRAPNPEGVLRMAEELLTEVPEGQQGVFILDEAGALLESEGTQEMCQLLETAHTRNYKVVAVVAHSPHAVEIQHQITIAWKNAEATIDKKGKFFGSVIQLPPKRLTKDLATELLMAYCQDKGITGREDAIEYALNLLPFSMVVLDHIQNSLLEEDPNRIRKRILTAISSNKYNWKMFLLSEKEGIKLDRKFSNAYGEEYGLSRRGIVAEYSHDADAAFEAMFPVDPTEHKVAIRNYLGALKAGYSVQPYYGEFTETIPRYTPQQLDRQEWDQQDFDETINHVRNRVVAKSYFHQAAGKFEVSFPMRESVIRLDQEEAMAKDVRNNIPVLVRGFWRIGKTSMLYSLSERLGGSQHTIILDTGSYVGLNRKNIDEFMAGFGEEHVVKFILSRELEKSEPLDRKEHRRAIQQLIAKSKKTPFEYLNDWLEEKGETVFLGIDEIVEYYEDPEVMSYFASLSKLSNFRVAFVLHQYGNHEDAVKNAFYGLEPHYIRRMRLDETKALLAHQLEGTAIHFNDEAVEEIHDFAGGRPQEVSLVVRGLLDPLLGGQYNIYNPKLLYTAEDIRAITNRSIRHEWFVNAQINYQRIYTYALTDAQRRVVDALVQKGAIAIGSIDTAVTQPLLDANLLVEDDKTKKYNLNGTFFANTMKELLQNISSLN